MKVVRAFENNMLMRKLRMLPQPRAQSSHIARVNQIDGPAKIGILNALVMPQIQTVGERGFFDVPLQARPTRKSRLARNGELGIGELGGALKISTSLDRRKRG